MDFRITMGPWLDWMFTLLVVGGAIVFWTIIVQWLITEIKSWFPKDEETVTHNPQFDPTTVNVYNNMAAYSAKDAELTQQLFDQGLPTMRKKSTEELAKAEGILNRPGTGNYVAMDDYDLLSSVNVTSEQVQAVADKIKSDRLPEKKLTEADAGIVIRQGLGRTTDLMSLDEIASYSPSEETNTSTKPSYIVQWSKYGSFIFDDDDRASELTKNTDESVRRLVNEFGDGYIRWQLTTDGPSTWTDNGFITKEILEMPNYANQHTMETKNA